MAGQPIISTKPFHGARVEVDTLVSYDEVLSRLRRLMGDARASEVVALAREAMTEADYVRKIEERFVGESGFMLFHEIDHGGWLPRFGVNRRAVRWILGNPLIAITIDSPRHHGGLIRSGGNTGDREGGRSRRDDHLCAAIISHAHRGESSAP